MDPAAAAQGTGAPGNSAARSRSAHSVIATGFAAEKEAAASPPDGGVPVEVTSDLGSDPLAYGVPALWRAGDTGKGTTVALIESFGDPAINDFITRWSRQNGLPAANVSTITPAGALPNCTVAAEAKVGCADWVGETDLDVAMVHAMAPEARILIVAS